MAGHTEGGLKSCDNAHVHAYLFMCFRTMGQSREMRFSNLCWNLMRCHLCKELTHQLRRCFSFARCTRCYISASVRSLINSLFKYLPVLAMSVSLYKTSPTHLASKQDRTNLQMHSQALFDPRVTSLNPKKTAGHSCQVCRHGFRWIELGAVLR